MKSARVFPLRALTQIGLVLPVLGYALHLAVCQKRFHFAQRVRGGVGGGDGCGEAKRYNKKGKWTLMAVKSIAWVPCVATDDQHFLRRAGNPSWNQPEDPKHSICFDKPSFGSTPKLIIV